MDASKLTTTEIRVLDQLLDGYSDKQIAIVLGCTLNTVKVHMKNIRIKTGTDNRVQLAILWYKHKQSELEVTTTVAAPVIDTGPGFPLLGCSSA